MRNLNKLINNCSFFFKIAEEPKSSKPKNSPPATRSSYKTQFDFYQILGSKIESKTPIKTWNAGGKNFSKQLFIVDKSAKAVTKEWFSIKEEYPCLMIWFIDPEILQEEGCPKSIIDAVSNSDVRQSVAYKILRSAGENEGDYVVADKKAIEEIFFVSGESAPKYINPVLIIKKSYISSDFKEKLGRWWK